MPMGILYIFPNKNSFSLSIWPITSLGFKETKGIANNHNKNGSGVLEHSYKTTQLYLC
jgi:hypothetical protein